MPDTPSTNDQPDLDLIDLAMRDSAVNDADTPAVDAYADMFAARGIGAQRDEAPLTTVDDPTGTLTGSIDPAATLDDDPVGGDTADVDPAELSPQEREQLAAWVRRMEQIPADRIAALDYYLATGELPGAAAGASSTPPAAPAPPPPDPVASIDFSAIEDAVGKETADALRAMAEATKTQRDEFARTQQMVMTSAQREQAEAQQRALAEINAASTAFAQRHGLDEAALSRLEERAASLNVLPAFAQQGMPISDAMTRALDLALRSDDTYLDELVQRRVQDELAKANNARTQRVERKQLATQVAGTGGNAPRSIVPIDSKRIAQMSAEERREAMVAEARAAFSGQ